MKPTLAAPNARLAHLADTRPALLQIQLPPRMFSDLLFRGLLMLLLLLLLKSVKVAPASLVRIF